MILFFIFSDFNCMSERAAVSVRSEQSSHTSKTAHKVTKLVQNKNNFLIMLVCMYIRCVSLSTCIYHMCIRHYTVVLNKLKGR